MLTELAARELTEEAGGMKPDRRMELENRIAMGPPRFSTTLDSERLGPPRRATPVRTAMGR